MSTQHVPTTTTTPRPRRAARCLRHHVWLAGCGDCREAHADLLAARQAAPTGR